MDIETKTDNKVFIKIPLENGGFWQKEYFQNDLIGNVVNDFKAENHVDIPQDYFLDWNFKNKSLKMTDKIKTLLNQEIPTVCINQVIKKKPIKINYEDNIPDLVGKPFNDPFEVFLFTKEDKSLKIQTYDPITVNNLNLNYYSPSSSYCNGNNHLFISGGEDKNGEIIDNFWEIDLRNQNIAEPIKIPPKKNHSMIFIPNSYVFIVGGNDTKTFYFNTENAEVCDWANLNRIRTEPALQRISNNLYCFDNINKGDNDIFTIEKTELNSNKPEWILLTPKFNFNMENELKLNQKFFGVSKDEEENIIFLGGNIDNYNQNDEVYNYKYNTNLNTIELSNIPYRKYNFKEKTFLTYRKNIDYILPDFNKQHPEVVFFVKKNNRIEAIDYEPKLNPQLKSLKPPLTDFKYDFNMPNVAIPDPITDFNLDQQDLKINTEIQNNFNSNIKMNINEPSFQDNNFKNQNENNEIKTDYNNNISTNTNINTNFKEPEIEPTKEDLKLSLEINNDMLKSNQKLNPNKIEVKPNISTIDSNINNINNYQFNKVKNPNIENKHYLTNIPIDNNDIYVPKFHFCVNDPRKDVNLYPKGDMKTSINLQNQPQNINIDMVDINMPKRKEQDINLNLKGNKRLESSSMSGVISGTVANLDGNKINIENLDFKKDVNIIGTIKGIKIKEQKVVSNNPKNTSDEDDFRICGTIPGTKMIKSNTDLTNQNMNIINPKVKLDLKGPKINDTNIEINENIPDINVNKPKINLKSPNTNINNPNYTIKGNIPINNINYINSTQKIDISPKMPNFNLSGNIPGKSINTSNLDTSLKNKSNYNINNDISGIKLETSNIDINSGKIVVNSQKPKIPDYNLNGNIPGIKLNPSSNVKLKQDFNLSGIIAGNKNYQPISTNINLKNAKKIPDYNLNGNIPGIKVKNQNITIPSNEISIKETKNNLKKKDFYLKGVIEGKKRINQKTEINLKEPNIPNLNLTQNIPEINTNPPKVNLNIEHNNINIQEKEELKVNIPNYEISGSIPGTQINEKKIDLNDPKLNIHLDEGKIDKNINNINIPNNIGKNNELEINMPKIETNSQKIDLNVPQPKLEDIIVGKKEINIPKIEIPNNNINLNTSNINSNIPITNINLNEEKIPDYNLSGKIHGMTVNQIITNKDENIIGTIPGINKNDINLHNSANINLSSSNLNMEIKNPNIKLPHSIIENKAININENNQNINLNLKKENISPINMNINPLEAEFSQDKNVQITKINKALDYNICGNIPGVKVTKLSENNSNSQPNNFYIQGIIPSNKKINNSTKNIVYKINRPDVQLTNYKTFNTYNNNMLRNIPINKNFHGNINDANYLNYFNTDDIKGSRRIINPQLQYNTINNINNNIDLYDNKVVINDKTKNNTQMSQNVNLVINKMEILPEENFNITKSQNIVQKSNNEYYPPQIENISEINYNYQINNNNTQLKANNYDIVNNLENKFELKSNNNNQSSINHNDIQIEIPKVEMNLNYNDIKTDIPNIEIQNHIQNSNDITNLNNHKLTELRFRPIKEDSHEINYEENNANFVSNQGNSKIKNKDLPLVGLKNNNFKTSKIGTVGNLNTENIDINNLKSASVGVNGIKIGDRIIE